MASNWPATTMASPMAVRFSPMRTKPVAIAVRTCKGSPDGYRVHLPVPQGRGLRTRLVPHHPRGSWDTQITQEFRLQNG